MLSSYIGAAFAAVAVETVEEERFFQSLLRDFPTKSVLCISASGGLQDVRTRAVIDADASFAKAFETVAQRTDTLLVVEDWQHLAKNAGAYRALKNAFPFLKSNGCCAVLVAPSWSLPPRTRTRRSGSAMAPAVARAIERGFNGCRQLSRRNRHA